MATKWTTTRAAEKQQKLVRCVAVADVDVAAVSGQQQQRSSSNIRAAAAVMTWQMRLPTLSS